MGQQTDTVFEIAKWLGGAAAGALLMYMLDPDRGSARRAQSVAAVRNAGSRTTSALGNVWHEAGERIGAISDDLRNSAADIAERIRPDGAAASGSALERMGRAAGAALDAGIDKARDTLARTGDAVESGMDKAKSAASQALDSGTYAGSHGAGSLRARMRDVLQGPGGEWTPTARNSALAGGGLLALYALTKRSPLALLLGLGGALLLARGAAGQPVMDMLRNRTRSFSTDQTIDFSKSIHIDAAPEDVYDLWTNYENFPQFMSHVVEVRDLGRGRSHWVVRGPAGSEYTWNSVLTEQDRPHRLAWRSEAGADIPQTGAIQFEPHRGGTRVTVRMSYTPPAGVLGHGLASLLGSDPKAQMDDDLARMKAFIERGAVPRDAARPRSGSRWLH
jgi:uncharacterized membrane protein